MLGERDVDVRCMEEHGEWPYLSQTGKGAWVSTREVIVHERERYEREKREREREREREIYY